MAHQHWIGEKGGMTLERSDALILFSIYCTGVKVWCPCTCAGASVLLYLYMISWQTFAGVRFRLGFLGRRWQTLVEDVGSLWKFLADVDLKKRTNKKTFFF